MEKLVGYLLLFVIVSVGFILIHLLIGKLIRPARMDAEQRLRFMIGIAQRMNEMTGVVQRSISSTAVATCVRSPRSRCH